MFFQRDYLMRQVEMAVQFIARLLFRKDAVEYVITNEAMLTETDLLYRRLLALIHERKLCEAEDMLYEELDVRNRTHLTLALDFYQRLNRLSDEELERHNFTRQEILNGIDEVAGLFSLPSIPR